MHAVHGRCKSCPRRRREVAATAPHHGPRARRHGRCILSGMPQKLLQWVGALFLVGLLAFQSRGMVLRTQPYAQAVLGAVACLLAPLLTLLSLASAGHQPVVGIGTIWQIAVMAGGGAVFTPALFGMLDWTARSLSYQPSPDTSFRPDREIKRSRQ